MKNMIILILVFLVIGAFIIKTQSGLSLGTKEDRREFAVQFGHWAERIFSNAKEVTAHAVKLDWVPDKPTPTNENQQRTENKTKNR